MSRYVPNGEDQHRKMLKTIGADGFEDLLQPIPEKYRLQEPLDLPPPVSEMELLEEYRRLAGRNTGHGAVCFAGGGAYDHLVPAVVDHVLLRSEFYTAYTPYQAEASQGTLQSIFEYQTMVARLTGMEVANASMYDGASAAAEAALMAMRITRRNRVLVAGSLNPAWLEVMRTYLARGGFELNEVPFDEDGRLDLKAAAKMRGDDTAAMVVQYPNYFGTVEGIQPMADLMHEGKALLVVAADPVSMGMLRPPGDMGADVVVGEGQSLGLPLSYGGPYCGFMAGLRKHIRKMPGRIVGRTEDRAGGTGYVMTLQTREQHIRREKATSNICTNQALAALANAAYLALAGETGLRRVAELCFHKSHYLFDRMVELPGVEPVFDLPFFGEFLVRLPVPAEELRNALLDQGYLAGVPLVEMDEGALLVAVTEKRTKEEMDGLVDAVRGYIEEAVE
ncbi:aminomethyl-transferring glycine dehydrogenase subunit GcvPA [Candidatus Fermentibacteria bacterium]|nr:aminomethyl-transferring glycine dehydrogenase subunit GcvPA [Candidatus Fermentibacteria bacterium]